MATELEVQVAAEIADFIREQAAKLPPDASLRGLALRSAERWGTVAQTRHLTLLGPEELARQKVAN